MTYQPNIDPALADHLTELAELAREIGATGVTIIRRPGKAQLNLRFDERAEGNSIKILDFAYPGKPAGVLVVLRFPQSDGGKSGVEGVS